jgi:hypothetical protein
MLLHAGPLHRRVDSLAPERELSRLNCRRSRKARLPPDVKKETAIPSQ